MPDTMENPRQRFNHYLRSMKLQFWSVGKPHEKYIKEGVEDFTRRIKNYFKAEWVIIPSPKNAGTLNENDLRKKEAEPILQSISQDDFLVLLDENGTNISSPELADLIQKKANESARKMIFLIGGAFGADEKLIQRANFKWSLSRLVFPHMLVRLILAEQVYRACTILRNEKYHHS